MTDARLEINLSRLPVTAIHDLLATFLAVALRIEQIQLNRLRARGPRGADFGGNSQESRFGQHFR